jgi:hypothetical protein
MKLLVVIFECRVAHQWKQHLRRPFAKLLIAPFLSSTANGTRNSSALRILRPLTLGWAYCPYLGQFLQNPNILRTKERKFFVLRRLVFYYSYGGRPTSERNSCLGFVLLEPSSRLLLHLLEGKSSLGANDVLTHCLACFIRLMCPNSSINETV